MKDKIKLVIVFILGIVISVVISTYTYMKIKPNKKVSYIDKKELKSTSDPDYINGVYSSSNTINSNITNLNTTTSGSATINSSSVTSGTISYVSYGKLVIVTFYDIVPKTTPSSNTTTIASNLPAALYTQAGTIPIVNNTSSAKGSIRVGINQNSTTLNYWYTSVSTSDIYNGEFIYIKNNY